YHASSLLLLIIRPPPVPTLFPYTTLFRSRVRAERALRSRMSPRSASFGSAFATCGSRTTTFVASVTRRAYFPRARRPKSERLYSDRKSTRLNSSHDQISYAVFCLKKKKKR